MDKFYVCFWQSEYSMGDSKPDSAVPFRTWQGAHSFLYETLGALRALGYKHGALCIYHRRKYENISWSYFEYI